MWMDITLAMKNNLGATSQTEPTVDSYYV